MSKWFKEPLLHFALLGVILFALYAWLNPDSLVAPDEIVVDEVRAKQLVSQFERIWQRPPTADEFDGLVDGWVREEVMYREGLAMGLEQDDQIVRRRVAQKMGFVVNALVPQSTPDTELQSWLDENAEDYRLADIYSLEQVYLDPSRHGDALTSVLAARREALADGQIDAAEASDSNLLPTRLERVNSRDIGRTFGSVFLDGLATLPLDEWSGPVQSGFGVHLVRLGGRVPGEVPPLEQVRAAVERDYLQDQVDKAEEAFYQALRARYTVSVEADLESAMQIGPDGEASAGRTNGP